MRLLIAALVVTLVIASTAATFAIWPVVADAPWEDDKIAQEVEDTDAIRCKAALSFRQAIIQEGRYGYGNLGGLRDYTAQLSKTEREITRYC